MTAPQLIERNPYTLNAVIINHGRLEISAIFKIQVNSVARKTASVALLGAVARTAHNADCGRTCPGIDSQCLSTWVPRQKVALAGTYPLAADVWEIFPPTCRVAATPLDAVLFSGAHADWPIHVIFACESPKNVPITPLTQLVLLDPDGDAYMARQGARKPPSRTLSLDSKPPTSEGSIWTSGSRAAASVLRGLSTGIGIFESPTTVATSRMAATCRALTVLSTPASVQSYDHRVLKTLYPPTAKEPVPPAAVCFLDFADPFLDLIWDMLSFLPIRQTLVRVVQKVADSALASFASDDSTRIHVPPCAPDQIISECLRTFLSQASATGTLIIVNGLDRILHKSTVWAICANQRSDKALEIQNFVQNSILKPLIAVTTTRSLRLLLCGRDMLRPLLSAGLSSADIQRFQVVGAHGLTSKDCEIVFECFSAARADIVEAKAATENAAGSKLVPPAPPVPSADSLTVTASEWKRILLVVKRDFDAQDEYDFSVAALFLHQFLQSPVVTKQSLPYPFATQVPSSDLPFPFTDDIHAISARLVHSSNRGKIIGTVRILLMLKFVAAKGSHIHRTSFDPHADIVEEEFIQGLFLSGVLCLTKKTDGSYHYTIAGPPAKRILQTIVEQISELTKAFKLGPSKLGSLADADIFDKFGTFAYRIATETFGSASLGALPKNERQFQSDTLASLRRIAAMLGILTPQFLAQEVRITTQRDDDTITFGIADLVLFRHDGLKLVLVEDKYMPILGTTKGIEFLNASRREPHAALTPSEFTALMSHAQQQHVLDTLRNTQPPGNCFVPQGTTFSGGYQNPLSTVACFRQDREKKAVWCDSLDDVFNKTSKPQLSKYTDGMKRFGFDDERVVCYDEAGSTTTVESWAVTSVAGQLNCIELVETVTIPGRYTIVRASPVFPDNHATHLRMREDVKFVKDHKIASSAAIWPRL